MDHKAVHLLRNTDERVKESDAEKEKKKSGEEKSEAHKCDTHARCSCLEIMLLELMNNVPPALKVGSTDGIGS